MSENFSNNRMRISFFKKGISCLSSLLAVPAVGYFAVQKLREQLYSWGLFNGIDPPIPVISVGNVLIGGSGKTPFVIYLAELLRSEGFRPVVVSRGYKGSNSSSYLVVNDGCSGKPAVGPAVSGDEPYLIANRAPGIPVIIGRERIHPVQAALELFQCDVAVLDDGFQHLPVSRRLDIVLLNGSEDRMFPLGRLREPLSALKRADVVMLVGIDSVPEKTAKHLGNAEVFRCRFEPASLENQLGSHLCSKLTGSEVVLCSAIAGPERFRKTAEQLGWVVNDHWVFRDHHAFTDPELLVILRHAADRAIVVTEKDWVKLPDWFLQKDQVFALRIKTVVENEEKFLAVLKRALRN
ncbi:MAG: tetraacyldisaccharide 4'-kinase [Desulfomonile tiedjei]|uniref:Tetraacyldisaccharide 4'-kinase n=1 Tax=Desulfomonile tiedjei TaxID=2358 RepID=A0A9D6Z209_9BACT|nr:tetraacyldisaccharide 4'-kinase [Desulfomonile tiedjei]